MLIGYCKETNWHYYSCQFITTLLFFVQMSPVVATGINNRQIGSTNNNLHSTPPVPSHGTSNSSKWSASCLRPAPPLRPCLALGVTPNGSNNAAYSTRRPMTYKEDSMILDVIEAYCSAVKPRNTVNSGKPMFLAKYIWYHFGIYLFIK